MALLRSMTDPRLLADQIPPGMAADAQHPMHAMTAPIVGTPRLAAMAPPQQDPGPEPAAMNTSALADLDGSAAAPPSAKPKVRTMTPTERYEDMLEQRQMADYQKDLNPYGSAGNHPGFFGKFLHGLSVATGGPNRRQFSEAQRANELEDIAKQKSAEDLQRAQAENLESQIAEREQPEEPAAQKPITLSTDKGIVQWDGQHWVPIEVNGETVNAPERGAAARGFQHVAGSYTDPDTGKTTDTYANFDPIKGTYTDLTGKVLTNFKPKDKSLQGAYGGFGPAFLAYRMLNSAYNENPALLPYISPLISKMLAGAGGATPGLEEALSSVPAGQPMDENGNPLGLRMPGAPTGATRSRGQFAESVLPSITDAKQEVTELAQDLGPMAGRYNELYTGKIGAYGPQFSHLQTTLKNIGTAWMRLHANSETARQEFEHQLGMAQDPANLLSTLDSIDEQAKDYVAEGKGRPNKLGKAQQEKAAKTETAPELKVGTVRQYQGKNWRFKGGDQYDQKNWEEVKK